MIFFIVCLTIWNSFSNIILVQILCLADLQNFKLLMVGNPTMEVGNGEKLKQKNWKVPLKKATTIKRGVAKKGEFPNLGDEGKGLNTIGDDDNQVLMVIYDEDDWVIDFMYLYHICRDRSLFTKWWFVSMKRWPFTWWWESCDWGL